MKKSIIGLLTGLTASLLVTSCGPTPQEVLQQQEQDFSTGALENSMPQLQQLAEEENDDQLLWRLMAGTLCAVVNQPKAAIAQFDFAEDIFSRNDKASVYSQGADGAMSILNNDSSFPYNGIGQDRIFCCFYKAVNYLSCTKPDAARTEFNRAMEHQENWLFERRKEIANAEEALEKAAKEKEAEAGSGTEGAEQLLPQIDRKKVTDAIFKNSTFLGLLTQHCGFDLSKSGNIEQMRPADYQNAYIAHFCGVFRYLNGNSSRDFLRNAAELNPNCQTAKADFEAVEAGKVPENDVWLYLEDGLCSNRKEVRIDLPLILIPYANQYVMYAGMAFPALSPRIEGAKKYTVTVGGNTVEMEQLEDIDRLIKIEYDVYMHAAVKREITRCLVKVGVQVGLGIAADQVPNNYARMGLKAAQVAAAGWARATTAADIRCWATLPKRVFVAHVKRPADGKVVLTVDGSPTVLEIPAGNTIVWMRKAAPPMPVRVKILPIVKSEN